ncbi:MAG: 4-hydroxy-tetrahydrodipicolinate synthase [Deltaproteobacteria bacterium]|nr:4-hydroxy-tetrahydrodipicolinate synthase [Deltaproteobacteria bacterium]
MKPLLGSFAALATPFKDGGLDLDAYRAHARYLIEQGTDGLVPIGTTGEASTMSPAEQALAVKTAVEVSAGKVPVVAGAGSNSTAGTIDSVKRVREAGADAALVVTPFYNKPTQDGLVAHYRAVAQAHPGFPLVAYNVPGRTGVDLLPETCKRLAEIAEVVGVKEATASMTRMVDIVERCGTERLALLSGDDFTIAPFISLGGKGVISVSANVAPRLVADLVHAALKGDFKKAAELQVRLNPLHRALFLESNPIPVKAAMHLLGRFGPEMRLPLTPMSEGPKAKLLESMKGLGLL